MTSDLTLRIFWVLSDGEGHTVREVTDEIYGASAERWRFNSVRKSLCRLMSDGLVRREKTMTVVPVWRYFLLPKKI